MTDSDDGRWPGLDLDAVEAGPTATAPGAATSDLPSDPVPRSWSWTGLLVGLGFFVAAVVAPLFREQGTHSWQAILAEDGPIYSQQAIRLGGVRALFHGFAGYLQLPPRLLALLAPVVPLRGLAVYFALAGVFVAALLAWFVYWASDGWIAGRLTRVVLASFLVLMPALAGENTANIVNTIWVFAAVTPWALVSLREGTRDTVVRSLVVFLAATATPITVVFVPVALGWAWWRRSRSAIAVAISFGAGLLVQGLVVVTARDTSAAGNPNSYTQLFQALGSRVYGVFVIGTKGVDAWGGPHRALIYLGAPLIVAVLYLVLLPGVPRRAQVLSATFMAGSVAGFLLPVWGRGSQVLEPTAPFVVMPLTFGVALRYSVIPILCVASALALVLDPVGEVRHRAGRRLAVVVFAVQVSLLAVLGFSVRNYRSAQLQWPVAVDSAYAHACKSTPSDRVVTVPTSVFGSYSVNLPCRDLAP